MFMTFPTTPRRRTAQTGLSLIGVLIATFILVSGALAIARLVAQTKHTTGLATENFVAASLAREGLELVQNQRDTNWFGHGAQTTGACATTSTPDNRDECWMVDLCDEDGQSTVTDHKIAIDRDPSAGIAVVHNPTAQQQRLFIGQNNIWSHLANGEPTQYSRSVSLDCGATQATPPVVEVTSRVTWTSRRQDREAVVKERLYNWHREE